MSTVLAGRTRSALILLACWSALAGAPGRGQAQEASRVHAILAVDTATNPPLAGLANDLANVESVLRHGIAAHRLNLAVLSDRNVTAGRILGQIASLDVRPGDALFFFYSGHGATDPGSGQYLDLSQGQPLARSDLRRAILEKNPRLAVILTDCCSNRKTIGAKEIKVPGVGPPPAQRHGETPLQARCRRLFFEQAGTVDLNSSTYDTKSQEGEVAWGDDEGGLFTRSFARLMKSPAPPAAGLSWSDFAAQLQGETGANYARFRSESLANPRAMPNFELNFLHKQSGQHPQVFADTVNPWDGGGGGSSGGPRLGLTVFGTQGGVRVGKVVPNSPAGLRGFEVGDTITAIDGRPISGEPDFARAVDRVMARGTVRFDVLNGRNGNLLKYVEVTLAY